MDYFAIESKHSRKVLDVFGASRDDGAEMKQYAYVAQDNQQWQLDPVGDGCVAIRSKHSGKVLDVFGASLNDGAEIMQYAYLGQENQKWRMESVGGGYFAIRSKHSGKVLDVFDASLNDGAEIKQYAYVGQDNQKWRLLPIQGPAMAYPAFGPRTLTAEHSLISDTTKGFDRMSSNEFNEDFWTWLGTSDPDHMEAVLQPDGNFVVYLVVGHAHGKPEYKAKWSSKTQNKGVGPFRLSLSLIGGNLVLTDRYGTETWHAPHVRPVSEDPCRLTLQDDGNLVLYDANDAAIWASNTAGDTH